MQKVEEFRKHAEECRAMATHARSLQECNMLLSMACTWDDLAEARVAQIAERQRVIDIAFGPGGDGPTPGASIPVDKLNASNDE
jgi:hypothetical protein